MNNFNPERRKFLQVAGAGALALGATLLPEWMKTAEAAGLPPFEQGKYQTFPGLKFKGEWVMQEIDLGTLGPDVDTIAGMDFLGNIPTGALEIYRPTGIIGETRVVFIKRTDIETVQLGGVLRGDRFDMHKVSEFGIDDAGLDRIARLHAQNTGHTHQKVVYIGDIGLFEKQYGTQEKALLNRIIRAQRPGMPTIGIPESNFVNPRIF